MIIVKADNYDKSDITLLRFLDVNYVSQVISTNSEKGVLQKRIRGLQKEVHEKQSLLQVCDVIKIIRARQS